MPRNRPRPFGQTRSRRLRSPPRTCRSIGVRVSGSDSGIKRTSSRGMSKLYWTYFRTSQDAEVASGTSMVIPEFFSGFVSGDTYFYLQGWLDWNLTYNTIDLEAGRKFAVGESAWIRPSLGIKTAVIQQKATLDLADQWLGLSAEENVTHDFWGIGPSFGISGAWVMPRCRNLSLVGSFSADLLVRPVERQRRLHENRSADSCGSVRSVHDQHEGFVSRRRRCLDTSSVSSGSHEGYVTITARVGYELQWWANQQRMTRVPAIAHARRFDFRGSYMRRFRWLLVCCLLLTGSRAFALEFFGDFLYWQATEPVDWTMNTNASTTDQYVAFRNTGIRFHPGIQSRSRIVGPVRLGRQAVLHPLLHRSRRRGVGQCDAGFFGLKNGSAAASVPPFFQTGNIQATIDYNVLDLDFGKSFCPSSLSVAAGARPKRGLDQSNV